jgi:beta-glucanase (GH16 family)
VRARLTEPPEDPIAGRELVFDDGFASLDTAIWNAGPKATVGPSGYYGRSAFARVTGEEGFNPYSIIDDPLATEGKVLQIAAQYIGKNMAVPNYYGNSIPEFQWVSGNLQTATISGEVRKGWRNGYFEARMLFPRHPLTWPAFWLLNKQSILSPQASVEIDVVEHKGWETQIYGAYLHEWGPPDEHHEGVGVSPGADLTRGYHQYGVLIDGSQCAFYFDRKPISRVPGSSPTVWTIRRAGQMDQQGDLFWPLLTLALRTDVPFPAPLRTEDRSARLLVDYVRVYV